MGRLSDPVKPEINPGKLVTLTNNGRAFTEVVTAIGYRSAEQFRYVRLSPLQRIVRKLTPPRWRKPIPLAPSRPSEITLTLKGTEAASAIQRHQALIRETHEAINKILLFDYPGQIGDGK